MNRWRAYLELVRIPNAFTAVADSLAGYWLASGRFACDRALIVVMAASACLYAAGIVLNDLMDIEIDRRERPARPLPSGRISIRAARRLFALLMMAGLGFAVSAGVATQRPDSIRIGGTPGLIACAIAACIALYDGRLKHTPLGPLTMGGCRGLNILMGMAAAGALAWDIRMTAPITMCLYVASFTSFGRDEVRHSRRGPLIALGMGILAAVLGLGCLAAWRMAEETFTLVLWLALLIHLARITKRAIRDPSPRCMQYAMKTYILAIVAFDAVIASAALGWQAGMVVLALVIPASLLGRWIYVT